MARIRTLKPEFWQDEKLAPLDPITRLVFLGLISQADDAGRLIDSIRMIDGILFPYSDHSSGESVETLRRLGRIQRYVTDSGQRLIQVVGWDKHQKVKNPSTFVFAPPPLEGEGPQPDTELSVEPTESLRRKGGEPTEDLTPRSPIPDPLSGTPDQGSRSNPPTPRARGDELARWLGPELDAMLDDCPLLPDQTTRNSLYSNFGPPGLQPGLWAHMPDGGKPPPEDRPRLLVAALTGYASEGNRRIVVNEFAGLLGGIVRREYAKSREDGPLFPEAATA